MPQQKRYESRAEQQKAYLERKAKREAEEATEEAYVAAQLQITEAYVKSFPPGSPKRVPEAVSARMERSEAYARWRFKAFEAGEVGSL